MSRMLFMSDHPTSVRLPPTLIRHIKVEAQRRHVSMSDVIREKLLIHYQGIVLPHRRGAIRKGTGR